MPASISIESVGDMGAIHAEWDRLAHDCGNPFMTHEWASSWWQHRGRGTLDVRLVRDGDRLAAVLPMFRAGAQLRFLGHGDSDILEPVCSTADRTLAADALRQVLGDGRERLLDALWMPGDAPWASLLRGVVLDRAACPEVRLDDRSWEEFLAGRSANFRSQVRRRRRALEGRGDLGIRQTQDRSELDADLDILFRLHDLRFGSASVAFEGDLKSFHRAWAALALERGWLHLWTLTLDDEAVASLYVFRFGGVDWFFQSGRDPRFERERVGFVLLCHALADACESGQRAFSLLRGGEAYKDRFADHDPTLQRVAVARGPVGRGMVLATRGRQAAVRARATMRRRDAGASR